MRLADVILVKVVVTALLWCGPLLLAPPACAEALRVPFPNPPLFGRLLGAAYAALLVAYWHGWREARDGGAARAVVRMGVVSNGLAAVVLAGSWWAGGWAGWGPLGQAYLGCSLTATTAITLGLLVARRGAAGSRGPLTPA